MACCLHDWRLRSKQLHWQYRLVRLGPGRVLAADRLDPRRPDAPDPWDAEVERQLSEAVEVCPHCLAEQPPAAWFCKGCGRAVGPYNNLMPYLQVFSEGEVFRNGATGQFRNRPLILAGYFLVLLGTSPLLVPLYLLWLLAGRGKAPGGRDARQLRE